MTRLLVALTCLSVVAARTDAQAHHVTAAQTLARVQRLFVDVRVDDTSVQAGVDTSGLRVKAELAARRLGISVLTRSEFAGATDAEDMQIVRLVIQVNATGAQRSVRIASEVHVSIWQNAFLTRDPTAVAYVQTWAQANIADLNVNTYGATISGAVDGMLEEFSNDYLAANPIRR